MLVYHLQFHRFICALPASKLESERNLPMLKRSRKLRLFLFLPAILMLFASCGKPGVGTIPSGTPNVGDGTPAVIPATPLPSILTASIAIAGNYYAFVRENQLWVAANGAKPAQVSQFHYNQLPDVFWHLPQWSPNDQYIAFIMAARPIGQGGGGCPAPDYGANGGLYVYNTATHQLSAINIAAHPFVTASSSPQQNFWQYMFWEDSTHLLAWYNGPVGKTSSTAGLYRLDLTTGTLSQVLPLSVLGVATLFNAQPGQPLMLSMRYSNEQLYYQVVVHPFEQHSQFVIYRHSILQPGSPGSVVLQAGSEPWCASQQDSAFMKPGWDVSPDGEQLAVQVITASDNTQGLSSVKIYNLRDNSTTTLFAQAAATMLGHDLNLTWGPDSQSLVAATGNSSNAQVGLYSASLSNPTVMTQYEPGLSGSVTWRSDSADFALSNTNSGEETTASAVYVFTPDTAQGTVLLTDAQNFVWG
jgi:hypothetical protein